MRIYTVNVRHCVRYLFVLILNRLSRIESFQIMYANRYGPVRIIIDTSTIVFIIYKILYIFTLTLLYIYYIYNNVSVCGFLCVCAGTCVCVQTFMYVNIYTFSRVRAWQEIVGNTFLNFVRGGYYEIIKTDIRACWHSRKYHDVWMRANICLYTVKPLNSDNRSYGDGDGQYLQRFGERSVLYKWKLAMDNSILCK